jgi:hypothetical protein
MNTAPSFLHSKMKGPPYDDITVGESGQAIERIIAAACRIDERARGELKRVG